MKTTKIYAMLSIIILMCACEKFTTEESKSSENAENGNVTLHLTSCEGVERISFGIFKDGEKKKTVHQSMSDNDFGTIHPALSPGIYELVVIAHNGKANCTISSPEKITFANNKVTDTFYYYDTLNVDEDSNTQKDIPLQRAVGMFRLHINDEIPTTAHTIKFYYTGGSSTFNAKTGLGCVHSRQTEIREMTTTQKDYDVYTFPQEGDSKLKMTITVLDAYGSTLANVTWQDIPITRDHITQYSGALFTNTGSDLQESQITFRFNPKWEGYDNYDF